MKIRYDFVTNSSSSSYILALHKDFNQKDLDELIEKNRSIIDKYAKDYDLSLVDAEREIRDNFGCSPDLTIDDWNFFVGRAGDGFGDFYRMFMYYINAGDTDHFRVRYGD